MRLQDARPLVSVLAMALCLVEGAALRAQPNAAVLPPESSPSACTPGPTLPPNLLGEFSRDLLNAGVERTIYQTNHVHDYILGTEIFGRSWSTAQVHVEFLPSAGQAVAELVVNGVGQACTTGFNGPMRSKSHGVLTFEGRKRVVLDADGWHDFEAVSCVSEDSELLCLTSKFPGPLNAVLTGLGWRRYPRQKPKGEAIGEEHAQWEINDNMDNAARQPLADANQSFHETLRTLQRRGLAPRQLSFRTTTDRLEAAVALYAEGPPPELAAPPSVPASAALGIRVHQGFLERIAQVQLAGKRYTQAQLDREFVDFFQELSLNARALGVDFRPRPRDPLLAMTFAREKPIGFVFAEHGIEVTIRATALTVGTTDIPAFHVRFRYVVENNGNGNGNGNGHGFKLVREPLDAWPADVDPAKPRQLSGPEKAFRALILDRLESLLPEEAELDDLHLSGDFRKVGPLPVTAADTANGWLLLAWKTKQPAP